MSEGRPEPARASRPGRDAKPDGVRKTARKTARKTRFRRPRLRGAARADRLPAGHDHEAEESRAWRGFFLRAVPISMALAVLLLVLPDGALLPLAIGVVLGALALGFLGLRRLEEFAHEADELEQENARLLAEVEARDPALAEREALREALVALMRRDHARRHEMAGLGHELRNPLAGVTGVARLLSETELNPEQETYVQAILRATRGMGTLTDALVASVDGRVEPDGAKGTPVRLGALVGDIAELLAPGAHAKGLDIAAFVAPALPRALLLDERRLRQVLLNLLGNAIKYTDEGGVGITARGDGERLVLCVIDSGVGIAPEERARMFEATARAPATRGREGAGLGLALVARLVAEMDGTVAIEDGPDRRGTGVVVSLPLKAAPSSAPMATRDLEGRRVRLDAARPITTPLLAEGLRVRGARISSEASAEAIALHDLTGRDPLAFIDDVDAWGPAARHVAILRPDQRRHLSALRAAGIDGYLIAPVRPRSLVAQVLGSDRAAPARHALLVEDDPVNGLVATRLLETSGWRVVWETDGRAALEAFAHAAGGPDAFALVLTDLDLPGMDGAGLVAGLARRPDAPRILVATGDTESDKADMARRAGAADVLQKPLTRAVLEDALAE